MSFIPTGLLALAFMVTALQMHSQISINEVCAANENVLMDDDGDYSDWIELYNESDLTYDLHGWGLADKVQSTWWLFDHVTLPAHAYIIVFASGKNRVSGNFMHTNFRIAAGEEGVFLFDALGVPADQTGIINIPDDHTWGRKPEGHGDFHHLKNASPGTSNQYSEIIVDHETAYLTFSNNAGVFDSAFDLKITCSKEDATIYYTTDGSVPGINSKIFIASIRIERDDEGSMLATIPTCDSWEYPEGEIFKGMVVRAVAYANDVPVSFTCSNSYFVSPEFGERYQFPVVSLFCDPQALFNDTTGIYVTGISEDAANFTHHGEAWERSVYMEMFDASGKVAFEQALGMRIHGRSSRYYPQKSLRLYADEDYGRPAMDFPFFGDRGPDSFNRILLRSPDRMFSQSYIVDPLTVDICKEMDLDMQAYVPTIVFINGEYWGIHQLRERLDEYYLSSHYGTGKDDVDILDYDDGVKASEGDDASWKELESYLRNHSLSDAEAYGFVSTQVDIESFIDYICAELFFANQDFPRVNQRMWRSNVNGGKWRFFFFDADNSMSTYQLSSLDEYLHNEHNEDPASLIFSSLLANHEFTRTFAQRLIHHLSTTFEPIKILGLINTFEKLYAPMVSEHVRRWHSPDSFDEWTQSIEDLRVFAEKRSVEMAMQTRALLPVPFLIFPQPARDDFKVKLFGTVEASEIKIQVMSERGEIVSTNVGYLGEGLFTIDTAALSNGIYIVHVVIGKVVYHEKLVVIH